MFVLDGSPTAGRGWRGLVILLVVVVGAAALWWFGSASAGPGYSYACVVSGSDDERREQREICHRKARDAQERAQLPGLAGDGLHPSAREITSVVQRAICTDPAYRDCQRKRPATAADVEVVRGALAAHGYGDAVVRLAREDDPAPGDSVIYGVGLADDLCFVSYAEMGRGADITDVVGELPGGECLTN
ncbi:MAG: hypothetical protein ABW022_00855 [Actinoplanes sp.]